MGLFRPSPDPAQWSALTTRVARLEEEVARLRAELDARTDLAESPDVAAAVLMSADAAPDLAPVHQLIPDPPAVDPYAEARALAAQGSKIHAIQLVIEQSGMSLKAAKDLVDSW